MLSIFQNEPATEPIDPRDADFDQRKNTLAGRVQEIARAESHQSEIDAATKQAVLESQAAIPDHRIAPDAKERLRLRAQAMEDEAARGRQQLADLRAAYGDLDAQAKALQAERVELDVARSHEEDEAHFEKFLLGLLDMAAGDVARHGRAHDTHTRLPGHDLPVVGFPAGIFRPGADGRSVFSDDVLPSIIRAYPRLARLLPPELAKQVSAKIEADDARGVTSFAGRVAWHQVGGWSTQPIDLTAAILYGTLRREIHGLPAPRVEDQAHRWFGQTAERILRRVDTPL